MGLAIRSVLWITCAAAFALAPLAGLARAAAARIEYKGIELLGEVMRAPTTWNPALAAGYLATPDPDLEKRLANADGLATAGKGAGTLDTVMPGLLAKMKGKTGGQVKFEVIDGADHLFRDPISDEVAGIGVTFVAGGCQGTMP